MNRPTAPRNPGIDLLRGLSILLVILHHVAHRIPLKRGLFATVVPVRLLNALSDNGYEAVSVFFVIWQEKAYLPGMAAIAAGVLGALGAARFGPPRLWVAALVGSVGAIGIGAVLLVEDLLWPLLGNGTVLVLTASATSLVVACHWHATTDSAWRLPGTGWLQSFGRLSYECYLTHMFIVFGVVRLFRASGGALQHGYLWYLPALALSWLAGALVARFVSSPCERALRTWWAVPQPEMSRA
jgi:peptidoglycan/LPS O-acetylase OafA/YrhL